MNIKNNKEVIQAVRRFSYYLVGLVALAVCIFSTFMKTASVEVNRIFEKTQEYDYIRIKQIALTESMDTLFFYSGLLNSDQKINTSLMFNVISERKNSFLTYTNNLADRDSRIYKRLASQMNVFLSVKDSIYITSKEEELLRADLVRCISDNKAAIRRLAIGGLSYNQ